MWRARNPSSEVHLSSVHLPGAELAEANLRGANLCDATLRGARLDGARLDGANLRGANLRGTRLDGATLDGANLTKAMLNGANLRYASLDGANLTDARLSEANLTDARLDGANLTNAVLANANLTGATCEKTVLADLDLSHTVGLDSISHNGPSVLDHRTLVRSGPLPLAFLRGCGLPDALIDYLPSLFNAGPIQFYSCFISYSTANQDFADRLHADLQARGVRCWFAPHDMQPGKKIHDQIDEAIRVYDRLLLILSAESMSSRWVKTEIAKARKKEIASGRRVLFPVALVSFSDIRTWEQFDADLGDDSAKEIREYFVPDFSEWKTNHDAYQRSFEKVVAALQSADAAATGT